MVFQEQITVPTAGHRDLHDLTDRIQQIVTRSGVKAGLARVFNVGSTAAVGTIEFEPGLQRQRPVLSTVIGE